MIKLDLLKQTCLYVKHFILSPYCSQEFEEFTDPAFYTGGVEQYLCCPLNPHYITDKVLENLSVINPKELNFNGYDDLNYFYLIDKVNNIKNIKISNYSSDVIQIVLTNANVRMVDPDFYIKVDQDEACLVPDCDNQAKEMFLKCDLFRCDINIQGVIDGLCYFSESSEDLDSCNPILCFDSCVNMEIHNLNKINDPTDLKIIQKDFVKGN